jgi:hypothetical protein
MRKYFARSLVSFVAVALTLISLFALQAVTHIPPQNVDYFYVPIRTTESVLVPRECAVQCTTNLTQSHTGQRISALSSTPVSKVNPPGALVFVAIGVVSITIFLLRRPRTLRRVLSIQKYNAVYRI